MKKSSLFCVRLLQVTFCVTFSLNTTHQSFNLWIAHYPVEICLERADFRGQQCETVLVAMLCLCDIPSNSELVRGRKTCNWLCICQQSLFCKHLSALLSSMLSFQNLDHVWLKAVVFSYSIYNVCNDVTFCTSLFIVVAFAWQI